MTPGRCLVLNASHEFLHVTQTMFDSMRLLRRGKVNVLKAYPTPLRSAREEHYVPAVAVLKAYVPTPRKIDHFKRATIKNVLVRDKFVCQYCGTKLSVRTGTKDHVIPRCQGGADKLTNVVAACKPCNNRKADKSPEECGMKLRARPRELLEDEKLEMLVKVHKAHERNLWRECLVEHNIKLF